MDKAVFKKKFFLNGNFQITLFTYFENTENGKGFINAKFKQNP